MNHATGHSIANAIVRLSMHDAGRTQHPTTIMIGTTSWQHRIGARLLPAVRLWILRQDVPYTIPVTVTRTAASAPVATLDHLGWGCGQLGGRDAAEDVALD